MPPCAHEVAFCPERFRPVRRSDGRTDWDQSSATGPQLLLAVGPELRSSSSPSPPLGLPRKFARVPCGMEANPGVKSATGFVAQALDHPHQRPPAAAGRAAASTGGGAAGGKSVELLWGISEIRSCPSKGAIAILLCIRHDAGARRQRPHGKPTPGRLSRCKTATECCHPGQHSDGSSPPKHTVRHL